MITLSKNEIGWIIAALQENVQENKRIAGDESTLYLIRALANQRADTFESIIDRLVAAHQEDHKRIAIR